MLEKMRANSGPWFVFEHVRPFTGVSLDLIVRQIRRGVLTEASIVRGPATQYQWRFAAETPGLCRYFGWCWRCHGEVSPSDSQCPKCHAFLGFEPPRPKSGSVKQSTELRELSAAVDQAEAPAHEDIWDEPPRVGRISVTWIALALIIIVILVLMWITQMRDGVNHPGDVAPGKPLARHSISTISVIPAPRLRGRRAACRRRAGVRAPDRSGEESRR